MIDRSSYAAGIESMLYRGSEMRQQFIIKNKYSFLKVKRHQCKSITYPPPPQKKHVALQILALMISVANDTLP